MKDKFGTICKVVVIVMLTAFVGSGIMFIVDSGFNGMVGDWFVEQFVIHDEWQSGDSYHYIEIFSWPRIKSFISILFVAFIIFWALTILATYFASKKRLTKQAAAQCGKIVREYLTYTSNETTSLPEGYDEVVACVNEFKAQMAHNEQLIQYEAAQKNDLITYLAHDLKTPLTSVVGYLSLLDEAPDMPTEQKAKYVHIALDKALRLESLINDFFEITRYNLHEVALDKEDIDLSYMLRQMSDEFYPMLQAHGNSIGLIIDENLTICADPNKLARVFNNILKNAIAYSYPNTPIEIKAGAKNDLVWVTFSNSGKTIPKRKLDSIFEKFYRLDDARSSNTGGAGLGLAIAKEIVVQHGGSITAVSDNQVTTFIVELPKE